MVSVESSLEHPSARKKIELLDHKKRCSDPHLMAGGPNTGKGIGREKPELKVGGCSEEIRSVIEMNDAMPTWPMN